MLHTYTYIYLIIGPPASGKTTICQHLYNNYNMVHISCDHSLNCEKLSPLSVLKDSIERGMREGRQKYVVDGCPLSLREMETFEQTVFILLSVFILLLSLSLSTTYYLFFLFRLLVSGCTSNVVHNFGVSNTSTETTSSQSKRGKWWG
jgi:hypothetical protein